MVVAKKKTTRIMNATNIKEPYYKPGIKGTPIRRAGRLVLGGLYAYVWAWSYMRTAAEYKPWGLNFAHLPICAYNWRGSFHNRVGDVDARVKQIAG